MEENQIANMTFDYFVSNFDVGVNKIKKYPEGKNIVAQYKPLVQPAIKGKAQVKWATR